jgi:hypothetical protein
MNTNQTGKKLRELVVVEMFERMKENLRAIGSSGGEPEANIQRAERMIGTLRLAIESLEPDAADAKIERQIRRLRKDIAQWEKMKGEWERRLEAGGAP